MHNLCSYQNNSVDPTEVCNAKYGMSKDCMFGLKTIVFKLHNMNYSILKWRKEPKVLEVFTRTKVFLRGNSMVDFISAYLPKMSGMHLS